MPKKPSLFPLIPPTKNTAAPKAAEQPKEPESPVEVLFMQIDDHLRAVGEIKTRIYNILVQQGNVIRALQAERDSRPKP